MSHVDATNKMQAGSMSKDIEKQAPSRSFDFSDPLCQMPTYEHKSTLILAHHLWDHLAMDP
jgi:hypothetical protein